MSLDDATTRDLNLEAVFQALDTTRTTPGRALLFRWLKNPCSSSGDLEERRNLVEPLRDEGEARRVKRLLERVGPQTQGDLEEFLWNDWGSALVSRAWAVRLGFAFELAVAALSLWWGWAALGVILVLSVVNLGIYLRTTRYIGRYTASMAYLGRVLAGLRKASRTLERLPEAFRGPLDRVVQASSRVPLTVAWLLPSTHLTADLLSAFFEYYRIFLLGELRAYFAFQRAWNTHCDALREGYELLGKLDASQCLADLEASDRGTVRPSWSDRGSLTAVAMVHPLVEGFVPLTVTLTRGAVVTGTNMAGKSTFLRTLGLNQTLATTWGLAFAAEFHTTWTPVMSALEINDDLVAGKSRYLAQAERILEVIAACERGPVLALIDEILSGTNSRDRIRASVGILRFLSTTPALIVASTHDLEIAHGVQDLYDGLYFQEILDDGLHFDYQIHQGIVEGSNALRLLEHLGFSPYLG